MSIRVKALLIVGMVFCCGVVPASAGEMKTNTFTLAPEVSYITYKESEMKETGVYYGVFGSYAYHGALFEGLEKAMLKAEARVSAGQVDYDGHLSDGTPYKIDNVKDVLFELRSLAGYDFEAFSSTTITPFFGLGYRFLSDNLSKDPAGYRRFANYFYSPIGVETRTSIGESWTLGLNLEYDLFWFGKQYSDLSDFSSAYGDVTNDQHKGYGFRAAVKVVKTMSDMNLLVEPYVVYWNIDRSKDAPLTVSSTIIGSAYEPKNTSTEIGVKVGVEF